ncbi:hypothetical protein GGI12_003616 [Dipsacomyces acuminosporus]|nr:hypothetical protein GGI12_003616 [Dipsacomyces acuminosporus]
MAVAKSILAEITDDTNRTRAMALLPLFWNLGLAMGSAVGGLFAHPAEQYPSLFGDSWVFREFPYLLPCLIGSSVTLFGRIVCAFKFEETLASKIAKPRHDARDLASETTPLIQQQQQQANTGANAAVKSDGRRSVRELLTPTVVTVMVTNVFLCLSIAMDNQIYPIFAATGVEDGGLGFDTRSIGISLSTSGVVVLYLQLVAYPRWEKKYGSLYCYQSGQRALIPFYLLLPFLSNLAVRLDKAIENTQGTPDVSFEYMLLWVLLTILLLIRVTGSVLVFTSVNLLTANLAPTTNDLGFMNGAQQLAMSGARVVGPLAAGCIWSWSLKHDYPYPFNSHLVWVVCALLAAISQYMSFSIPESVNKFAAAKGAKHGDGDGNGNGDGDLE